MFDTYASGGTGLGGGIGTEMQGAFRQFGSDTTRVNNDPRFMSQQAFYSMVSRHPEMLYMHPEWQRMFPELFEACERARPHPNASDGLSQTIH